jgi:hypothetical protein
MLLVSLLTIIALIVLVSLMQSAEERRLANRRKEVAREMLEDINALLPAFASGWALTFSGEAPSLLRLKNVRLAKSSSGGYFLDLAAVEVFVPGDAANPWVSSWKADDATRPWTFELDEMPTFCGSADMVLVKSAHVGTGPLALFREGSPLIGVAFAFSAVACTPPPADDAPAP